MAGDVGDDAGAHVHGGRGGEVGGEARRKCQPGLHLRLGQRRTPPDDVRRPAHHGGTPAGPVLVGDDDAVGRDGEPAVAGPYGSHGVAKQHADRDRVRVIDRDPGVVHPRISPQRGFDPGGAHPQDRHAVAQPGGPGEVQRRVPVHAGDPDGVDGHERRLGDPPTTRGRRRDHHQHQHPAETAVRLLLGDPAATRPETRVDLGAHRRLPSSSASSSATSVMSPAPRSNTRSPAPTSSAR